MKQESPTSLHGEFVSAERTRNFTVAEALPNALVIRCDGEPWDDGERAERFAVTLGGNKLSFGKCVFLAHPKHPSRRAGDPPKRAGHGLLVPLDEIYDFRALMQKHRVISSRQRIEQLPLISRRKEFIKPAFRQWASDLIYDLQVYRGILDAIDRGIEGEEQNVAETIRAVAVEQHWPQFCDLFDKGLSELKNLTQEFSKQEHEVHGFYFRKQVWDLILASEFLARTNLKPRGYAGDSEMMRMVYENTFRGPSIFARYMHKHPIITDAAQAVRNRVGLLAELMGALQPPENSPLRVMSVACGPVREMSELLNTPEDARRYHFTFLDQDDHALNEATTRMEAISQKLATPLHYTTIQASVRTMLRAEDLSVQWGRFHFLYSMGLFDYLTVPVARAVLARLYELLEPGGEMVIGNYHLQNPTRLYMEYWMDWVLFYRSEGDFIELCEGLENAKVNVIFEDTRSQMFLRIRKLP